MQSNPSHNVPSSGGGSAQSHEDRIALFQREHAYIKDDRDRFLSLIQVLSFLLAGVSLALFMGDNRILVPPWHLCIVVMLFLLPMLFLGCFVLKKRGLFGASNERKSTLSLNESGVCNPRLVCYGALTELSRVDSVTRHFHEPIIVSGSSPEFVRRQRSWAWITTMSLLVTGCYYAGWSLMPWEFSVKFLISVISGFLCMMYAMYSQRVYFRVCPGRLEILRAPWVGYSVRLLRAINLHEAKIICDYPNQRLTIESIVDSAVRQYEINLGSVRRPHLLAESVFSAARNPFPAPPLPGDELLG